jgi:hypothetical protein
MACSGVDLSDRWRLVHDGPYWDDDENGDHEPCYVQDTITGKYYYNESSNVVRFKSFLVFFSTPFVSASRLTKDVLKLGYYFTNSNPNEKDKSCETVKRIRTTFFFSIGLQLAAFYGLLKPYDARIYYGELERSLVTSEDDLLAPCFQPINADLLSKGKISKN